MNKDKKITEMLKRAIKNGDVSYKIVCLIFMKLGFSNEKLQALEIRNRKYKKISKKYQKYINNINYEKNNESILGKNKNIWICWLQGLENAPQIVKICVDSIIKKCPDKNITIITSQNFCKYINFPKFIINKWKSGEISNTHFSDLIRTELLILYGGTWIDATTYLMDEIPSYIYKNDFFCFNYKVKNDITITYNNWFIYAEKDNRLLKSVRDLLYVYWKDENRTYEYFIWQFFMNMILKKYPEDISKNEYFSDEMSHMLQYSLNKKFDLEYWNEIKKLSPIQKLTYKLDFEKECNTYYEYIIKEKI